MSAVELGVALVSLLFAFGPTLVVLALLVSTRRRVRTLEDRVQQLEAERTTAAPPVTPTT